MTPCPSRWWRRRRDSVQARELVAALATAMAAKDAAGIRRLLDADPTMIVDGGPFELGGELIGRDAVTAELLSYPIDLSVVGINGAPGIVARSDGHVVATVGFLARRRLIVTLWSVRNPDKLRRWDS